jgi:purine nucleosidase
MTLAFAVASPEVDVLGVTVVDGDVELRARMAARILGMMGRADIPVFLGERQPMGPGRGPTILGFEGRDLLDLPYRG